MLTGRRGGEEGASETTDKLDEGGKQGGGGQRGEATLYRCGSIKVRNTHLNYCARVLVRRKVLSGMKLHADDDKKDEEGGVTVTRMLAMRMRNVGEECEWV